MSAFIQGIACDVGGEIGSLKRCWWHAVNEHQDLRKKYADECYERKLLYNKVLELKGGAGSFVFGNSQ